MFGLRFATLRTVSVSSQPLYFIARARSFQTCSSSQVLRVAPLTSAFQLRRGFSRHAARRSEPTALPTNDEHEAVEKSVASAGHGPTVHESSTSAVDQSNIPVESVAKTSNSTDVRPSNSLFIGNLFFDVTEEDLRREFSRFGPIEAVNIVYDSRGLSKGYGFISFDTLENAKEAMTTMSEKVFEGRKLLINYRVRQAQKPRRPNPFSKEESSTLFIGNMSWEMNDDDLNNMFKDLKGIVDVRVAIDRRTGQPRGFAHADFIDIASATSALKLLQGREIHGRKLRCDYGMPAKRYSEQTKEDIVGEIDQQMSEPLSTETPTTEKTIPEK